MANSRPDQQNPIATKMIVRKWYNQLAESTQSLTDWTFMNYGYADSKSGEPIPLAGLDEWNRYPIQLYHHLASKLQLDGAEVLDIGSGRGGGADYIARTFPVSFITGVDLSYEAIALCKKIHNNKRVDYVQGDAENLSFENESFDAITSVEATHCFVSIEKFLKEAFRVLRPQGQLVITDFRTPESFEVFFEQVERSNFETIQSEDISLNVIQALKEDHARKEEFCNQYLKGDVSTQFPHFAALQGSQTYEDFISGNYLYKTIHLKRST